MSWEASCEPAAPSVATRLGVLATWRGLALLALAFSLHMVAIHVLPPESSLDLVKRAFIVAGHVIVLAVAWRVRHLWGMQLVVVGLALNLAAIVANGGAMPVTPEARILRGASTAGIALGDDIPRSKGVLLAREDTRLWPLTDIFVVIAGPVRKAFSPGDFVTIAGMVLVTSYLGRMLARRQHRAAPPNAVPAPAGRVTRQPNT